MLILTESYLQCQKLLSPYKARETFSTPVCATRKRKACPVQPRFFYSHAATTATKCCPTFSASRITYFQNGSHQLITCSRSSLTDFKLSVIRGSFYCQPECDVIDDHTCIVRVFVQISQSAHTLHIQLTSHSTLIRVLWATRGLLVRGMLVEQQC